MARTQPPLKEGAPLSSSVDAAFAAVAAATAASGATPVGGAFESHNIIQNTWAAYLGMSDMQRNLLLKGLINRSSTKQIDYICSMLNLKFSQGHSVITDPQSWESDALKTGHDVQSEESMKQIVEGVDFHHPTSHMNTNMYIKLLNKQYTHESLAKQLSIGGPTATKKFVEFVSMRIQKLHSIMQSFRKIAIEPDITICMKYLVEVVLSVTSGSHATLYTFNEATGTATAEASSWIISPGGLLYCGNHVFVKGEVVSVYNVKNSEQWNEAADSVYRNKYLGGEPECILAVPVVNDNTRVLGSIEVVNKVHDQPPFFDAEDEFMIGALSNLWGMLLNQLTIREESLRKTDDIRVLLNTASLMSSELDLGDLISVIMQTAQELLNAERCALFMVDKERGELWSTLAQGAGEIRIPLSKGIAGYVATTGEILNIPNAYKDKRFNPAVDRKTGYRTRNILCMPMKNTQGEIIGVTQIINKLPENQSFTRDDQMLLLAFSSLAAVTIEKSILFKALQLTLQETSSTRNYLAKVLQSMSTVVISLDAAGCLMSINHPQQFGFEHFLAQMRNTSYESWLGDENQTFVADIRRTYQISGDIPSIALPESILLPNLTVTAQDYELRLNGMTYYINYWISPINAETEEEDSRFANIESEEVSITASKAPSSTAAGVVIVLEEITDEKRLMNAMARYMPPELVHRAMNDDPVGLVDGKRQKASVLFANIRNFTGLSESMDPTDVVALLNEHYTQVADAILAEEGLLDKFIGDAAMAIFGPPFPSSNDCTKAVLCALRLKQGLDTMNKRNLGSGMPQLKMGIGIVTGKVVCGRIGSSRRMDYTVIGETVKTGWVIENATKVYGISIIVCDRTRDEVKDKFHIREIDQVAIPGRSKELTLYEVVGNLDDELPHDTMTSFICYELGLAEYRSTNWQTAIAHFKKAVQLIEDPPSRAMMEVMILTSKSGIIDGVYSIQIPWDGIWRNL
ncbi:hypothetical protein BJ742DRAFT_680566 [Cladochytrium replicatum]|nr:hypothetical protein BJ742DRAFT_680566 [Cladochytrium replicatum]